MIKYELTQQKDIYIWQQEDLKTDFLHGTQ